MKIKTIDRPRHIIFMYKLKDVNDRISSLDWFAEVISKELFDDFRINLEDFESFHDGTESTCLTNINDKQIFVSTYANSAIVNASITGNFVKRPFSIGICLNDGIITLSCRKSNMVDYSLLETLLLLI